MYLVLIAWLYVAFMMAIAEATSPVGSLLGAAFTFLLYGVLPMSVVGYIMGAPARRRAIKAKEAAAQASANSTAPDAHSKPAGDPIAPIRKEL
jgi:hypothetical protein